MPEHNLSHSMNYSFDMADASTINVVIHVPEQQSSVLLTIAIGLLVWLYIGNHISNHIRRYLTANMPRNAFLATRIAAVKNTSKREYFRQISIESKELQPPCDKSNNLGPLTDAINLHTTISEHSNDYVATLGDLANISTILPSERSIEKEAEDSSEEAENITLEPSSKGLNTNYHASQSIYGPVAIFESPPTKPDSQCMSQNADSEVDTVASPAILTLCATTTIAEIFPLIPKVQSPMNYEPSASWLEVLDCCGCIDPIKWRPEHMLINFLSNGIVNDACDADRSKEIGKMPKDHEELFESSTSLILVALRLALNIECTGFVQWYQSNIDYWPGKIREGVLLSICDKPNREMFRFIAHNWLGDDDGKVRVLERLAYNGDLELIDYMLERYKTQGMSWYSDASHSDALDLALIAACAGGRVAVTKRLIGLGANIKGPNLKRSMLAKILHTRSQTFNETPLIAAAGLRPENYSEIIKILISGGARYGGPRAMQKALKERSADMIWCLLEHNIPLNVERKEREWALAIGVAEGHGRLVTAMLRTGINVNQAPSLWACRTVLQCAATRGDNANIQRFINHGADINSRGHALDWGGNCALIAAASCGHAVTVRTLLDYGAKVEGARSFFGDFLQTICYLGYASVLEVVLEVQPPGLDWSVRTLHGEDLLALAARAFRTPRKKMFDRADNEKVMALLITREVFSRDRCAS